MKQCPCMAGLLLTSDASLSRLVYVRCERSRLTGGWHLHNAPLPEYAVASDPGIRVRWRSLAAPDYHADYVDPWDGDVQ